MDNEHQFFPICTTDTNYNYNVGGEVKKTVPFTKELREWLLSFKAIGIRFVDTIAIARQFTRHDPNQVIAVFENGVIYKFEDVFGSDDGENIIKPSNVSPNARGRWVKKLTFSDSPATMFDLWQKMKYAGLWETGINYSGTETEIPTSPEDVVFYVNNNTGQDGQSADGTLENPFKTVERAINVFGASLGYWRSKLTLIIKSDYTDIIRLYNYKNCLLVLDISDSSLAGLELYNNGKIYVRGNTVLSEHGYNPIMKLRSEHNELLDFHECAIIKANSINDKDFTIKTVNSDNVKINKCSKVTINNLKGATLLVSAIEISQSTVFAQDCTGIAVEMHNCIATINNVPTFEGGHNNVNL